LAAANGTAARIAKDYGVDKSIISKFARGKLERISEDAAHRLESAVDDYAGDLVRRLERALDRARAALPKPRNEDRRPPPKPRVKGRAAGWRPGDLILVAREATSAGDVAEVTAAAVGGAVARHFRAKVRRFSQPKFVPSFRILGQADPKIDTRARAAEECAASEPRHPWATRP
jgi:hypothetical protein